MTLRLNCRTSPLLLAAIAVLLSPGIGHAQDLATVTVEENFRRAPNGVVLAQVAVGARLRVLEQDGPWTQVSLAGWVWMPSVAAAEDPAYDHVVSAAGGENLRLGPSGTVIGHVEEGAMLSEVSRAPSWVEISRVGWIWSASLSLAEPAPTAANPSTPSAGPASRTPQGFAQVGPGESPILTAPDGDTLGHVAGSSEVQVVDREGNWARVRLEGWMWMPVATEAGPALAEGSAAIQPIDLERNPAEHAGRVVSWTLQFISLERAEAVRTDFFQGEPFLLSRFGGADGPFVYVAVPTDRLAEVEGLVPLEQVVVTGRIRTAASALTGAPILDLVSIGRSPGAP